jgi:medium-chain acyl-[acyl-carrier-protein] hydrolase
MYIESSSITSPWLANVQARKGAALRLFCFHHAGGSTGIFHNWQNDLPAQVEIYPVQLPGRGLRLREPFFLRIDALIPALTQALLSFLECDFAFFGHSMGAEIAFELARALHAGYNMEPKCLFVSGRKAPQLPGTERDVYKLPDDEFIAYLKKLNGTPEELLSDQEMLDFMLPIIRADFELVHSYCYLTGPKLSCPIKALGGLTDEHVSKESLLLWAEQTTGPFSLSMMQGGHFFFQESRKEFMSLLSAELRAVTATLSRPSVSL